MQMMIAQPRPGYVARFADAVRQVFWYVLFGLAVGSFFVLVSNYSDSILRLKFPDRYVPESIQRLLEHVGMGFIVAAIAVLFYEWGAHLKEVERVGRGLEAVSGDLAAIQEAVFAQALDRVLTFYVNTGDAGHDHAVTEAITKLLESLKKLQEHGDWPQMGLQRFITAMIRRVSVNAEELADLSIDMKTASTKPAIGRVVVLTSAQLADTILATQIAHLPGHGIYRAVANPQDWRDGGQFPQVREETKYALKRGVIIRRILILTDDGPNAFAGVDSSEIERILLEFHAAETQSAGADYHVKVLDEYEARRLKKLKDDAAGNLLINHFAIIENPNAEHRLEVKVNNPELSDFQFEGITRDSQHLGWFDRVWEKLPAFTDANLKEILDRWNAAHPPNPQ